MISTHVNTTARHGCFRQGHLLGAIQAHSLGANENGDGHPAGETFQVMEVELLVFQWTSLGSITHCGYGPEAFGNK